MLPVDSLDRMTDMMTHRGPNDRGTFLDDGIALGVRRLSIVDVDGGHQPVSNEDGRIWAIQNGELYNHGDLRGLLASEGHVLRSHCDTEIIPHLYERSASSSPSSSVASSRSPCGTEPAGARCSPETDSG